jgi:hypothetical protein
VFGWYTDYSKQLSCHQCERALTQLCTRASLMLPYRPAAQEIWTAHDGATPALLSSEVSLVTPMLEERHGHEYALSGFAPGHKNAGHSGQTDKVTSSCVVAASKIYIVITTYPGLRRTPMKLFREIDPHGPGPASMVCRGDLCTDAEREIRVKPKGGIL